MIPNKMIERYPMSVDIKRIVNESEDSGWKKDIPQSHKTNEHKLPCLHGLLAGEATEAPYTM